MPPQDDDAEQSVLGAMLLSKDAIADVIERARGRRLLPAGPRDDLRRDRSTSTAEGEPVDPITVAAELNRRGELARVGGAPYLHTLIADVPIAANAGYYADIVREKAILRRLVDAGTRIAQMGYAGEGHVDDIVDRAQAEVYAVTERRTAEDYAPLSAIMEAHPRRDRGDLQARRRMSRRADRLRRPRRADQRPARRPDGHRRRPARDREVDAGAGLLPGGVHHPQA